VIKLSYPKSASKDAKRSPHRHQCAYSVHVCCFISSTAQNWRDAVCLSITSNHPSAVRPPVRSSVRLPFSSFWASHGARPLSRSADRPPTGSANCISVIVLSFCWSRRVGSRSKLGLLNTAGV